MEEKAKCLNFIFSDSDTLSGREKAQSHSLDGGFSLWTCMIISFHIFQRHR